MVRRITRACFQIPISVYAVKKHRLKILIAITGNCGYELRCDDQKMKECIVETIHVL